MSWRSVMAFFAGRSFGSPLASKPSSTCGAARSGNTLPIGSSSESVPRSTRCMPAGVVSALVDHVLACRGHRDHAGDLPGVSHLTQHLIDLWFALHGPPPDYFFKVADL